MKIMFYINSIEFGGAERVIANLADYFASIGNESVLVTSYYSSQEYSLAPGVRRLAMEERETEQPRISKNVSRIGKLRRICKTEKPDILISFMKEPNFRAVLATRFLSVKTVVSVRNDPNVEYAGVEGKIVGKILLPLSDGCVFQTEDARRWFPKRMQKKSRIICNAVKEEFYRVRRKPVRGEIITCGRLFEQKNDALLIDAFAGVAEKIPYATLKIYGEGPLKDELQKKIDNLGLRDKVTLMGNTDNVAEALKRADLFVLSSDFEGMPNALMEAMAAGVPSISTDCPCGGPRELFGKELSSLLVPVKDAESLREKIISYLESTDEEKKAFSSVFRTAAEKFSPDRVYGEWADYVSSVVERQRPFV